MLEIDFYCKKCKKSMRISYTITGESSNQVMNGVMVRCHTHKCTRVVMFKNLTETQITSRADAHGKCYV